MAGATGPRSSPRPRTSHRALRCLPTRWRGSPSEAMGFEFTLNGRKIEVSNTSTTTTLLEYLRSSGLTGSKQGCAEGDCGACTVAVVERDAAGRTTYRGVNSCIALLPMFADREVVTVEGLEGEKGVLHPVQAAMVDQYGSQCGD